MSNQNSILDVVEVVTEEDTQDGFTAMFKRAKTTTKKEEILAELTEAFHMASDNRIRKLHEVLNDAQTFKLKAVDRNENSKYGTPILTVEVDKEIHRVWGTAPFKKILDHKRFTDIIDRKNFSYLTIRVGDGTMDNNNKMFVIDGKF